MVAYPTRLLAEHMCCMACNLPCPAVASAPSLTSCCSYTYTIPANLDLAGVAPLVCAGITTYAPYKDHGLDKRGYRIGVVGLGGLGHMAVKFGVAFGCEVGGRTTPAAAPSAVAASCCTWDLAQVAACQKPNLRQALCSAGAALQPYEAALAERGQAAAALLHWSPCREPNTGPSLF